MVTLGKSELKRLSDAVKANDLEFLQSFFDAHPKKLNRFLCGNRQHGTALLFAVQHRANASAYWLLERGADPKKRTKGKRLTCLHYLFNISFDAELAAALLRAGADPCAKDGGRQKPIHMAVLMSSNWSTEEVGRTMLETVVSHGSEVLLPSAKAYVLKWSAKLSAPDWVAELFQRVPSTEA